MNSSSTIAAIATSAGMGAISVIRLSGAAAIEIADLVFVPAKKRKKLANQRPYTIHFGSVVDDSRTIDEVLVSIFKSPHSFTGENVVEISCHGSVVIQQQILELLIRRGARLAEPGEFTLRAFLNGKMDLSQAEGVADLIAASSEAARRVALQQMRGGFSSKLKNLREQLLHFTALIELELDFSEEDVEFADRQQLASLVDGIMVEVKRLADSFSQGNAIKNGIPVAIAGKPNVGKSTLLNRLLNEERAIVSDIAGTTRDSIEDLVSISGITFRFIDTAGLRETSDTVEIMGIERAKNKIEQASVVLYLVDAQELESSIIDDVTAFKHTLGEGQNLIILLNKADKVNSNSIISETNQISRSCGYRVVSISAKGGNNMEELLDLLKEIANRNQPENEDVIVTNIRHYDALLNAYSSLELVQAGISSGLTGDLLSIDIHQALYYIGLITGEVTTDEVLGHIFSKFCIGK